MDPSELSMRLTSRVETLGTESAFEVVAAARRLEATGRDIVHLEIGEPGIPTPPHIVEAGVRALHDDATHYTLPSGLPELRAAIADVMIARGMPASTENIVVTSGAKPMLLYSVLALVGEGDDVLVPDPGFPIYESVVRLAGARPVPYPVALDGEHGVSAAVIAAHLSPRTRLLVLNAPHNPTGTDIAPAELDAIAELVCAHDLAVISDEVYGQLRFAGAHESIATRAGLAERTVVIDSFSKTYAMTGWRLGYGVMPERLAACVDTLVVNSTSCAPPFVQRAGIAALTGPQQVVSDLVAALRQRRDTLVRGLGDIQGITCPTPPAAFYAFANVSELLTGTGLTTEQFATRLLEDYGTATLAGTGFGSRGTGHIRLSFATAAARIDAALDRIRSCTRELTETCSLR
jgi:aspartate/methionine/tyrosine aminotransferase